MTLQNTLELMCSDDYKERFKAEYYQLDARYNGLLNMLFKWDNGKLDFQPTCPREMYDRQIEAMHNYCKVLKERAALENIEL